MLIFILGIIVVIAVIVLSLFIHQKVYLWLALVGVGLSLFSCFSSVPTGYTGILTTFGRVENISMEAGFHFKKPWQELVKMDNREQRYSFTFECFSSDIQQVSVSGSVNYMLDKSTAMNLYREVGVRYSDTLISPRVLENTKTVFSRYAAETLISKRDVLSSDIRLLLKNDLENYGLNVISVSIEDIDFADAFTDAVERKQVATQNKLRAQTEQEQSIMESKSAASRQIIEANAQFEVAKIAADAEAYTVSTKAAAEAEANKKLAESITADLISYVKTQRWNGELPSTYLGSSDTVAVAQLPIE